MNFIILIVILSIMNYHSFIGGKWNIIINNNPWFEL